jgi:hypothetical protein
MSDIPISRKKISCGLPMTGRYADDRETSVAATSTIIFLALFFCMFARTMICGWHITNLGIKINKCYQYFWKLPYKLVKKNPFFEVISQQKPPPPPCIWVQIHEFSIITYDWKWRILINMPARLIGQTLLSSIGPNSKNCKTYELDLPNLNYLCKWLLAVSTIRI